MRGALLPLLLTGCSLYFGKNSDPSDGHPSADGAIVTVNDGGLPTTADANVCMTAFASDRWLVFDSDRENFNRDIYLMRPDGSQLRRLTSEPSIDRDPAASPDGTKIAFASNRSGQFQIHLLDLTTLAITQLTSRSGGAQEPSFSHDGTRVAFRSGSSVFTIQVNGTNETFVADSGIGEFNAYFSPVFSADDTELYFDRNNELDAIRLDGTGFRYIVQNWTVMIKAASVSPSGLSVAYHVQCTSAGFAIWATPSGMTTEPCKGRLITSVASISSERAAWGPDDVIAYEQVNGSNASAVGLVSTVPNSVPCTISVDPYDNRNPAWLINGAL